MRHVRNVKYKKRDENNNIRDETDNYNNNYSDDYERENGTKLRPKKARIGPWLLAPPLGSSPGAKHVLARCRA